MKIVIRNIKSKIIFEQGEFSSIREIRNYLSFKSDTTHLKNSNWNGVTYFLNSNNEFPTGMLPMVLSKIESKVELIDMRNNVIPIPEDWDFTDVREYQEDTIKKILKKSFLGENIPYLRGIIDAATNAGKDYIMENIYRNIKGKTLIIIHNTSIFNKAVEFFSEKYKVGVVKSGKIEIENLTIAMVKSLLNSTKKDFNLKKYLSEVEILMVDEGHRAASKEYQQILEYIDAPIRLLFSGTALEMESEMKKIKLVASFGKILTKIENKFMIESGFSQKPIIKIFDAGQQMVPKLDYREAYEDFIMYNKERTNKIVEICKNREDKQILISFVEIEHGQFLFDKISFEISNKVVEIVHGEDKEREEKIKLFKEGKIHILIASMILQEGINIPNINTLILAHGGKSTIRIKQFIGRALRHDGINDSVEIIDFYDRGGWVSKHSKDRLKIYQKEEFEIEFQYQHSKLGVPI